MKILTYDDLLKAVEQCSVGKPFSVSTNDERKHVLTIGRILRKKIATRKNGKGFKVYVLE